MLGVGDIRTQANDQWLCVLDTADGGEQFVESLSVNKVTTDFPLIKVNEAVEDVRKDNANNKIPSTAGGTTDLLLDMTYAKIHPVLPD